MLFAGGSGWGGWVPEDTSGRVGKIRKSMNKCVNKFNVSHFEKIEEWGSCSTSTENGIFSFAEVLMDAFDFPSICFNHTASPPEVLLILLRQLTSKSEERINIDGGKYSGRKDGKVSGVRK